MPLAHGASSAQWPSVTIVYVVYNRSDELRTSLQKMLFESDYEGPVDAIVVDNASSDGSADMVREEFPQVQLIARTENIGAPAWNEGYALARGDYVLTLDDDAYLLPDGLRRAVAAATEHDAQLVSFKVISTHDPDYVFSEKYRTGLFTFWGCAWLVRRDVLQELGGYDPQLFMWANELELMIRFLDRGYRHLHFPEVVGQHMKAPPSGPARFEPRGYAINARHWAYVAAKLLRPRDAVEALVALFARVLRDAFREHPVALRSLGHTVGGAFRGLRHRDPVHNPEVSRFYRRNFETFASPWWVSRPMGQLILALPGEIVRLARYREKRPAGIGRRQEFFDRRAEFYPWEPATLEFGTNGSGGPIRREIPVSRA
jgi:GT2 family glycosyltransferase